MKYVQYLFISLALLFSVFTVGRILLTADLMDFDVYYYSARYLLEGTDPYTLTPNGMSFIYPPPAILLLSWIGLFPIGISQDIWTILSALSLVLSVYLLIKIVIPKVPIVTFLFLLSLALVSFPVKFTLGMGQINLFILLLISLTLYFGVGNRHCLAGFMLALATMIKLSPVFLLLLFIKNRNFKAIGAFGITISCLIALSFFVLGKETVFHYAVTILPSLPTVGNGAYYNQALTGFMARAGIQSNMAGVIHWVVLCMSVIGAYLGIKQSSKPLDILLSASLLVTLSLIAGGLTWQHHMVLLIIPLATLYLSLFGQKKKKLPEIVVFSLAYCLIAYNIKFPERVSLNLFSLSHGLWGMILLLALLARALHSAVGPGPADTIYIDPGSSG